MLLAKEYSIYHKYFYCPVYISSLYIDAVKMAYKKFTSLSFTSLSSFYLCFCFCFFIFAFDLLYLIIDYHSNPINILGITSTSRYISQATYFGKKWPISLEKQVFFFACRCRWASGASRLGVATSHTYLMKSGVIYQFYWRRGAPGALITLDAT